MNLKNSSVTIVKKNSSIQVLRAIAILLVLSFHLKVLFPFGFLGVDAFFVISGFVITQLFLIEFRETNIFYPLRFLIRRVLRIVPALAIMIIFSVIMSYFFQTALQPVGGQQVTAKTSLGGLLFMDNYLIPRLSSGYFGSLAQENSMTHLWSISVEFQFYLVMALVFYLVLKLRRNRLEICVSFLLLISCISFYLFVSLDRDQAFFNLPARVWEFGVGIGLAFIVSKSIPKPFFHHSSLMNLHTGVGIASLVISQLTFFDINTTIRTLLVITGISALLIRSQIVALGKNTRKPIQMFLVRSGDISYSLYLYHWPVIVIIGPYLAESWISKFLLAITSFIFANFSFKYIEGSFKYSPGLQKKKVLTTIALLLTAIVFSGTLGFGAKSNWNAQTFGLSNPFIPFAGNCEPYLTDIPNCFKSDRKSQLKLMVIGDSQAAAYSEGFYKYGRSHGYSTLVLSRNGGPFLDARCLTKLVCNDPMFEEVIRYSPDILVIANLWKLDENRKFDLFQLERELINPLLEYSDRNKTKLVFVKPLPIMRHYDNYYSKFNSSVLRKTIFIPMSISSQYQINNFLDKVKIDSPNIIVLDPKRSLCKSEGCQAISNDRGLYRDKTHLSTYGAVMLVSDFQVLLH